MITHDKMIKYQLGDIGPKYPSMSEKSLARVMRALVVCRGRLFDSYIFDEKYSRSSVLYLVEIPEGQEVKFTEICGYCLSKPTQIVLAYAKNS